MTVSNGPELLFPWPVQPSDTDERYTPRWVFDALGATFDLDPAAPPGGAPNVPAKAHYSADDDGLAQPWHGLVWLNPPFSDMPPWVDRWIDHGNGLLLFPWSVNAVWIDTLLDAVEVVVRLRRPKFDHPTHTGRHVPVACAVTGLGDGVPLLDQLARHSEAGPLFLVGRPSRSDAPDCPECGQPVSVTDGIKSYECHHCRRLWPASYLDEGAGES